MAISRRMFLSAGGVSLGACLSPGGALGELAKLVGDGRPRRLDRTAVAATRPDLVAAWSELAAKGARRLPAEQFLFTDTATAVDNGVMVTVPPLYHRVVTAKVANVSSPSDLVQARQDLETVLGVLEKKGLLTFTPAGLGLAVGWGLPYFASFVKQAVFEQYFPVDERFSKKEGTKQYALLAARPFPSDRRQGMPLPVMEANHVVFVMASDHHDHLEEAFTALFGDNAASAHWFEVTSVRQGFVDGRHVGSGIQSLTKRAALHFKLPAAASIPDSAELFLGFTSTQRSALAPSLLANLETLRGLTDQWPNGYFRHGTTLHLSHMFENLPVWYEGSYDERLSAAFTPSLQGKVRRGAQTVAQPDADAFSLAEVKKDVRTYGLGGHSTMMQPESRLESDGTDNYGRPYRKGTSIIIRADFNTVDNPFAYSHDATADHVTSLPAAGVHFLSYAPTTNTFDRVRRAMDGFYPNGTNLGTAGSQQLTAQLQTTHRQNFIIPPRSHRSFPLAEI